MFSKIDAYCERLSSDFWAEPVNALTNVAFIIAACVMWYRTHTHAFPITNILLVVLTAIGIGSFLFHTSATIWASIADVLPILAFILIYLFAASRDFLNFTAISAFIGTFLFLPYAALLTLFFRNMPFFHISAFYWPVPVLILAFAFWLWHRHPKTAGGLAIGALLLVASLVFRSIDSSACHRFPIGTHFLWHVINAFMLAWMIEVYHRHLLAQQRAGR